MPDQYKLGFALWTRRSIVQLIKQFWGITIPVRTMGDYLKRWGFTPQKPVKKAWEKNPAKVDAWLREEYPQIKARAKKEKATIFWGDETGIKNTTQHGRCYAPKRENTRTRAARQARIIEYDFSDYESGRSVFYAVWVIDERKNTDQISESTD